MAKEIWAAITSPGALNLITVVLAVVTAWMAGETRRMAGVSMRMAQLELQPHLAIDSMKYGWEPGPDGTYNLQLGVVLSNPGKVVVSYRVENMSVVVAERAQTLRPFASNGGVIHPGARQPFMYPEIQGFSVDDFPAEGTMGISIVFKVADAEDRALKRCSTKMKLRILAPPSPGVGWVYDGITEYS